MGREAGEGGWSGLGAAQDAHARARTARQGRVGQGGAAPTWRMLRPWGLLAGCWPLVKSCSAGQAMLLGKLQSFPASLSSVRGRVEGTCHADSWRPQQQCFGHQGSGLPRPSELPSSCSPAAASCWFRGRGQRVQRTRGRLRVVGGGGESASQPRRPAEQSSNVSAESKAERKQSSRAAALTPRDEVVAPRRRQPAARAHAVQAVGQGPAAGKAAGCRAVGQAGAAGAQGPSAGQVVAAPAGLGDDRRVDREAPIMTGKQLPPVSKAVGGSSRGKEGGGASTPRRAEGRGGLWAGGGPGQAAAAGASGGRRHPPALHAVLHGKVGPAGCLGGRLAGLGAVGGAREQEVGHSAGGVVLRGVEHVAGRLVGCWWRRRAAGWAHGGWRRLAGAEGRAGVSLKASRLGGL
jgi:hypothetical protein